MQKRRSIALIEIIRKYFSHFSALVNNEVTRSHQRPDYLATCHIFFGNIPLSHNLLPIVSTLRQKTLDSFSIALSSECTQNCSNFNMLGYRGQEKSKYEFLWQKWFSQILLN